MSPTLRSGKRLREPAADDCSICLEGLPCRAKKLPCGHRLHGKCFKTLEEHGEHRCPLCRGAFRRPIHPIFDFLGYSAKFQSVQETYGFPAPESMMVLVYADTGRPVLTTSDQIHVLNDSVLILIKQEFLEAYVDDDDEMPTYLILGYNARTDGTVQPIDSLLQLFAQSPS
jgi:hypothetical protein